MTLSGFGGIVSSRPWRFAMLALVLALVFSGARLLTLSIMAVFLLIAAIRAFKKNSLFLTALIVLCSIGLLLHTLSMIDTGRVRRYMAAHTPPDPAFAQNGIYKGTGQGPRGPTNVLVTLRDGKIRDIILGNYLDAISIDRESIDFVRSIILVRNSLDINPDLIDRTPAIRGFYDAVSNAMWTADSGLPKISPVTRLTYFFARHSFSRFTFNALAIIFIVFLLFDYALQSVLRKDTGQSLVCYNCQTCVGACPVKMVEGMPYPMTMVLETRLGNYPHVAELARYCVGCGRCAGKCPAGISAPMLAAAAVSLAARERKSLEAAQTDDAASFL
ncbi:MAG TPA: 4Fe-4S dicluster domain-containing protein [Acidobacteriota bacterium]|nr:4Fe-4S dicluster domain-containing protein [Acidobacteriota bacterium]